MDFIIRPYQCGEEQYVADLHKKLYSEEYSWGPNFTDYATKLLWILQKRKRAKKKNCLLLKRMEL